MADDLSRLVVWGAGSALLCAVLHAIYRLLSDKRQTSQTISDVSVGKPAPENVAAGDASADTSAETRPKKKRQWKANKTEYQHPWLVKSLKGHPGTVLDMDFSGNGKYLASTCEGGSVIVWDAKNLAHKDTKSTRVNIELDHANLVAWSPDSKGFVVHKARDCCVKVYRLDKRKDGSVAGAKPGLDYPRVHSDPVVGFGISSTGRFMMSCTSGTELVLRDLRGEQLDRLDTCLLNTYTAKISPCGRFVVAAGFSPDVKVREVRFGKSGEYRGTHTAFELTGHTSGVWDVAFDGADTSHVATVSKDGTWKLYHTRIDYARGESPYVVSSGRYTPCASGASPRLALSPNAEVLAVAADNHIEFFDTSSGHKYHTLENVFADRITCVRFDASGKFALAAGDKTVRVFHNACGYHTTANACKKLLAGKQTSATTERLQATIAECKDTLSKLGM